MYTDHKLKTDFVCVLLPIFSGERDIKFELSQDGNVVTLHYTWPSQFYRASELFKASIDKGEISTEHPKVHCFVSNMIEYDDNQIALSGETRNWVVEETSGKCR